MLHLSGWPMIGFYLLFMPGGSRAATVWFSGSELNDFKLTAAGILIAVCVAQLICRPVQSPAGRGGRRAGKHAGGGGSAISRQSLFFPACIRRNPGYISMDRREFQHLQTGENDGKIIDRS